MLRVPGGVLDLQGIQQAVYKGQRCHLVPIIQEDAVRLDQSGRQLRAYLEGRQVEKDDFFKMLSLYRYYSIDIICVYNRNPCTFIGVN